MRKYFVQTLLLLLLLPAFSYAQFTHKIKADSVRIYNDSCNAELILENSTRNVSGFLFNTGNGRTQFKKAVVKLNDSSFIIGSDTLIVKYTDTGLLNSLYVPYTGAIKNVDLGTNYTRGLAFSAYTSTGDSVRLQPASIVRFFPGGAARALVWRSASSGIYQTFIQNKGANYTLADSADVELRVKYTDTAVMLKDRVNNATNTSLIRSGSGPYTLGLNLAKANIWTATQSIDNGAGYNTTLNAGLINATNSNDGSGIYLSPYDIAINSGLSSNFFMTLNSDSISYISYGNAYTLNIAPNSISDNRFIRWPDFSGTVALNEYTLQKTDTTLSSSLTTPSFVRNDTTNYQAGGFKFGIGSRGIIDSFFTSYVQARNISGNGYTALRTAGLLRTFETGEFTTLGFAKPTSAANVRIQGKTHTIADSADVELRVKYRDTSLGASLANPNFIRNDTTNYQVGGFKFGLGSRGYMDSIYVTAVNARNSNAGSTILRPVGLYRKFPSGVFSNFYFREPATNVGIVVQGKAHTLADSADVELRVKYTDTSSMLSGYARSGNISSLFTDSSGYIIPATASRKIVLSDTFTIKSIGTTPSFKVDNRGFSSGFAHRAIFGTDTLVIAPSGIERRYSNSGGVNAFRYSRIQFRQPDTDNTSNWFVQKRPGGNYAFADSADVELRVKYTDTAAMLSGYQRAGTAGPASDWVKTNNYLSPVVSGTHLKLTGNKLIFTTSGTITSANGLTLYDTTGGNVKLISSNSSFSNSTGIDIGGFAPGILSRTISFITATNAGSNSRWIIDSTGLFPAGLDGYYDIGSSYKVDANAPRRVRKVLATDTIRGGRMISTTLMTGGPVYSNTNGELTNTVPSGYVPQAKVVEVSGTTQQMLANIIYIPHNTSLTTFTIPLDANAPMGSQVQIIGEGSGGWKLAQNANDYIVGAGGVATTAGTSGYIQATDANCTLTLFKTATNKWTITASQGTLTFN
ncbi:hypothetical protein [Sediminibacterium ginsengisoli]|uniref:Uncharacterized protein n=1 Tax=Sediminibacterium ginsengisoli TaxID=413434 RepID=A0A1T4PNR2_9BACT|nr:hypothetical protein [Sediminibacterium ginsengisoli]SJZ93172.1 hypothetical protein SAMN04488132_106128 [Sediminibacterium ginsengisoli]